MLKTSSRYRPKIKVIQCLEWEGYVVAEAQHVNEFQEREILIQTGRFLWYLKRLIA